MSRIVIDGNVDAISKVSSVMNRLAELSNDKKSRVIRIGGDERWFDGSRNVVSAVNKSKDTGSLELNCNDSAYPTVIGVLKNLEKISVDGTSRAIRIGGEVITFNGSIDSIDAITVDGNVNADHYVSSGRLNTRPKSTPSPKVTTPTKSNAILSDKVDVIKDEIWAKMNNSEMFTAFDITKKVRSDGMRIFHSEVKDVISTILQDISNAGYTRVPVVLSVGKTALVYHKVGQDANDYLNVNNPA